MTDQRPLFGPLPSMVCGPCLKEMRPERDARGNAVWRCPKCGDECPRKENSAE